jgi:hypothetical protein
MFIVRGMKQPNFLLVTVNIYKFDNNYDFS